MKLKLLLASALFFTVSATSVRAIEIPNFPSCTSPTGSVKVSYDSGVHGIPGDSGEYIGSDIVYTVSDTTLIQCFCAVSKAGIQTNWWRGDALTPSQTNQLISEDWIFIPDGSSWGLDPVPYLAKNSNFSCSPPSFSQPSGGSAPVCDSAKPGTPTLLSVERQGSTAKLTWIAASQATHYTIAYGSNGLPYGVPNTGNVTTFTIGSLDPNTQYQFVVRAVNNCTPGDWSTAPIGGGQVLGLATTGNSTLLYTLLALGGLTLILAFLSRRRNQRA